ncbi:hypothetical protein [Litoribacter populi]|uniref:hypothetical protein n=1 Tax=Litoribacter populi TaxID=2598460 RepID=UPI001180C3B9|nr:hypothetical protein [Litoribacter populi]
METKRILIIGSGCFGLAVALALGGCTSTRVVSTHDQEEKSLIEVARENTRIDTEYFGDILKGDYPLKPLSEIPQVIRTQSGGMELELSITDEGVTYRAKAKPVARSTLSSEKSGETYSHNWSERSEDSKVTRKSWRLPWWVYLLALGSVAVGVLRVLNKVKNPFKLF